MHDGPRATILPAGNGMRAAFSIDIHTTTTTTTTTMAHNKQRRCVRDKTLLRSDSMGGLPVVETLYFAPALFHETRTKRFIRVAKGCERLSERIHRFDYVAVRSADAKAGTHAHRAHAM